MDLHVPEESYMCWRHLATSSFPEPLKRLATFGDIGPGQDLEGQNCPATLSDIEGFGVVDDFQPRFYGTTAPSEVDSSIGVSF